MAEAKTRPTGAAVTEFLDAVAHPVRRADGHRLNVIFQEVTGWAPAMWGPTIVGYGSYDYTYASGHSGSSLATGFSPRAARHSIYIMPGYQDYSEILGRLGKHKIGKACLYVNTLADVDEAVLRELIAQGVADLDRIWPVRPS